MTTATGISSPHETSPLALETYRGLADSDLEDRIARVKKELGESLLILGHHYQQDPVIRFADLRGDSLKLSQLAAQSQNCRSIVFCGVHFMAETADILSRDEVRGLPARHVRRVQHGRHGRPGLGRGRLGRPR